MTIRMLAVVLGFGATLSAGTVMAQPSAAPRTVAKLTSIVGGVLVSQADAMAAATGEQRLAPSTRVITTAGGSATVVYDKGCAVRLPENKAYVVRERGECSTAKEPSLGKAADFAVLGGTAVINAGASVVTGEVGVSPGAGVTGFPPGRVVNGSLHAADEAAKQAQTDAGRAYDELAAMECNVDLSGQNLGGLTLTPGVYCVTGAPARLTGELVLDAQGDPGAAFVFQIGAGLITDAGSVVREKNGEAPASGNGSGNGKSTGNGKPAGNGGDGRSGVRPLLGSVFWQVGGSASLGKESRFVGNVIATSRIDVAVDSEVSGRLLARSGQVTLDRDRIDRGVYPLTGAAGAAGAAGTAGALGAAAGAGGAVAATTVGGATWVLIGAGALAIGAAANDSNKQGQNPTPN